MAKTLLGAVGEKDAVLAFKAIGMRAVPAHTAQEANAAIHRLKNEGVRVIFITESAAEWAQETLDRYQSDPDLSIIPVPGARGSLGFGQAQLRANIIKAIGADIAFDQNRKEGT